MTDKAPDDPYADLVRRVLADEITLEAAAREATDLLQRPGIEGPHGFTLSLGASVPESKRLRRFFHLAKDEVLRRITADAPRDSTERS